MDLYEVIQLQKRNRGTHAEFLTAVQPFLSDKDSVLKLIKECCISLYHVPPEFKKDREIVLTAVKIAGSNLEFADPSFYDDKEMIMAALMSYDTNYVPKLIKIISENMRDDPEIALLALSKNMYVIEFLPEKYRNNKEFLPKSSLGSLVYKHLTKEARDDYDLVVKVVKECGDNLEFVPEKYRDDYDIVLSAVRDNGEVLQYASERLKSDPKIVKAAIREDWSAIYYASDEAKDNPDIMMYAIKKDTQYFKLASERLKNDPKFILEVLKVDVYSLIYASVEIQKELENESDPIAYLTNKLKNKKKAKVNN